MESKRIDLRLKMSEHHVIEYRSEGVAGDIGRISSVQIIIDGQRYLLPASGTLQQVCENYEQQGVIEAVLTDLSMGFTYIDSTGDGKIDEVQRKKNSPTIPDNLEGTRIVDTLTNTIQRLGGTLHAVIGSSIRPVDLQTIQGSCGSDIQIIVDSENFKAYELLSAVLPAKAAPGPVLRYKIGGDIFFIFTDGQGKVNHTLESRKKFLSVPVEISSNQPWQVVVLPPQEWYQVINEDESDNLAYFMFFAEHKNAFQREMLEELSKDENDINSWGFAYEAD